jgi:predicted nucleotidyltransferase component of viral defense system
VEKPVNRNRASAEIISLDTLEQIKKTATVAMFSDDELMEHLVLKGGNAMDLVYRVSSRGSVDLDFSIQDDLEINETTAKVERALHKTFEAAGYLAFDIRINARPNVLPENLAAFWGGYLVEFKLISTARATELKHNIEAMRREAIMLGEGARFTMDISRHEYTEGKKAHDLLGYRIYVYTPEMIVCEKIRAICQQLPEYTEVIQRKGKQRARDFLDITTLIEKFGIDIASESARHTLEQMFLVKHVPLQLIRKIAETRDFHVLGFDQVRETVKPGVELKSFDYYFDFVVLLCGRLEPIGDM